MKDELLATYTPEDLVIEYLMDRIEEDPAEEFPASVREAGTYGHKTGDALVDRWQVDASLGRRIDFEEAFGDPESRRAFEDAKAASRARHAARRGAAKVDDVHDDYAGEK